MYNRHGDAHSMAYESRRYRPERARLNQSGEAARPKQFAPSARPGAAFIFHSVDTRRDGASMQNPDAFDPAERWRGAPPFNLEQFLRSSIE
jgi:hypothetical protein